MARPEKVDSGAKIDRTVTASAAVMLQEWRKKWATYLPESS
jgi:hypothetical protein